MAVVNSISEDLREVLNSQLHLGERVLWRGHPDPALSARYASIVLFFGLPWTVMSLWMATGAIVDRKWNGLLICLPLITAGFWICGLPLIAFFNARRTIYAITDQRVLTLTVSRRGGLNVAFCRPVFNTAFRCRVLKDGSGNLEYAQIHETNHEGEPALQHFSMDGIPNVRAVEKLMRDTFDPPLLTVRTARTRGTVRLHSYRHAEDRPVPEAARNRVGAR